MSFTEKSALKDERVPLLRDPVYHYNHRYGRGRSYDPEEMDDLIGIQLARTQRFQWMLFLGVTFVSIIILLTTLGVLIRLSETHPPVVPKDTSSTTQMPVVSSTVFSTSKLVITPAPTTPSVLSTSLSPDLPSST